MRQIVGQGHWALRKGRNLYFNLHFPGRRLGRSVKTGLVLLWMRLRCKGQWGSWNTTVMSKITLRLILGRCLAPKALQWMEEAAFDRKHAWCWKSSWTLSLWCRLELWGVVPECLRLSTPEGAQVWEGLPIPKEPCVYGMNWKSRTVASSTEATLGGSKKRWQWWTHGDSDHLDSIPFALLLVCPN